VAEWHYVRVEGKLTRRPPMAGGGRDLPRARGRWNGVLKATSVQGGNAMRLRLPQPIKPGVQWPSHGRRARAGETRQTDRRTAGRLPWRVGKLHVAERTSGGVRCSDRGSQARLDERVHRCTTGAGATRVTSRRTFTFRPDRSSLGHFYHDLLPIFELKCTEE
jgi:hypothetical protein